MIGGERIENKFFVGYDVEGEGIVSEMLVEVVITNLGVIMQPLGKLTDAVVLTGEMWLKYIFSC